MGLMMSRVVFVIGVLVILVLASVAGFVYFTDRAAPANGSDDQTISVEGEVRRVAGGDMFVLQTADRNQYIVQTGEAVNVFAEDGARVPPSYIHEGFSIRAEGKSTTEGMRARRVYVEAAPAIQWDRPRRDETIGDVVTITGTRAQSAATATVTIVGEKGAQLARRAVAFAGVEGEHTYRPFSIEMYVPVNVVERKRQQLTVTVNADGISEGMQRRVTYEPDNRLAAYHNDALRVSLAYPDAWSAESAYGVIGNEPVRYSGTTGFMQVSPAGGENTDIETVTRRQVEQQGTPYGENPRVEPIEAAGRDGRLILPADPSNPAAAIMPYETVIEIPGAARQLASHVLIQSSQTHIRRIMETLRFRNPGEVTFDVFFSNFTRDPQERCGNVFPVQRTVFRAPPIERQAVQQLLEGPRTVERERGYFTRIPSDVSVVSVDVTRGTASVTLEGVDDTVGKCKKEAMASQVRNTLLQFDSVDEVTLTL